MLPLSPAFSVAASATFTSATGFTSASATFSSTTVFSTTFFVGSGLSFFVAATITTIAKIKLPTTTPTVSKTLFKLLFSLLIKPSLTKLKVKQK